MFERGHLFRGQPSRRGSSQFGQDLVHHGIIVLSFKGLRADDSADPDFVQAVFQFLGLVSRVDVDLRGVEIKCYFANL